MVLHQRNQTKKYNAKIVGYKGDLSFNSDYPDGMPRKLLNTSRMDKLGWKPMVKIEDGILKLLKNIHMWKNAPVWDAKKIKIVTKDWFKYLK